MHGANRLGANSLLDIVVFGRACANRVGAYYMRFAALWWLVVISQCSPECDFGANDSLDIVVFGDACVNRFGALRIATVRR